MTKIGIEVGFHLYFINDSVPGIYGREKVVLKDYHVDTGEVLTFFGCFRRGVSEEWIGNEEEVVADTVSKSFSVEVLIIVPSCLV